MKHRLSSVLLASILTVVAYAQQVSVRWDLSNPNDLSACELKGEETYTKLISTSYLAGAQIDGIAQMTGSNADAGYTAVSYTPSFTMFGVKTRTSGKTMGHNIAVAVKPEKGHTFKPTKVSFDAAKCGTDGGNFDVVVKTNATGERGVASNVSPLRNKITSSNSTGFSHHEYELDGYIVEDENFVLSFYLYNINGSDTETPKSIAFRNIIIEGVMDEPLSDPDKDKDKQDRDPKPEAKPLNRGLMSVSLTGAGMGSGNLVSWRYREADSEGVKFKLWRGTNETSQTAKVNSGNYITTKTNFLDASGTASSYYRLEVYDAQDNLIETQVSGKTWTNQSFSIPLGTGPTDPDHGASYTPNDASFCDMDGDGEYEIILKWSPSNEKDAASSGTTSSPYFDCIKMDGTRLWRIRLGDNFFTSAHTIQFIAWDLDGDGYGEFMCKTGPGTVDGEGKYVLLGNDDPKANLLSGRGKQDHGSEYITVFDGTTGAELYTMPYHTAYNDESTSFWGDDKQNRSERYLAALAYLDGPDKNPSAIFARGYYSGAKVGAYDWDGKTLKLRWLHRSATSGKELWGEGAHWISVGDVDGDQKQEIIYGSACLDDNGKLLYRTGLGHGDALHLGDMIPGNEGLEVLMCHEHKPYGIDIRDARTGKILLRQTEGGDTGRGLAAHFDSSRRDWQFLTSGRAQMYNCSDESVNGASWAIGSSGAGINCRVYWDGDLYDEFFDKSIIAHWNPTAKSFDRYRFNNGNYLWGNLNNGSKNNPCVLGDILGDWREEIVTWTGDNTSGFSLYINATSYTSDFRLPHLMDDPQYRVQVVAQNVCYNQPPHLSYDPAIRFAPAPKGLLAEDSYYVRNVGTGMYLQGGSYWGTRAVVGTHPSVDFNLKLVADNTYTFDSNISNGGASHYLSAAELPYVDGNAAEMAIGKITTNIYKIGNGTGFLYAVADSAEVSFRNTTSFTNKAYRWQFLTRKDLLAEMESANAESPADATFLIADPNLGRNDQRYAQWQWSADCTNKNNSGAVENYCVESYHSPFTFSQTLTDIPNGYYGLRAQGFYRVDGEDTTAPQLFANTESLDLPLHKGTENNMTDASSAFLEGEYQTGELLVQVNDGTMQLGIRNDGNKTIWAIWDNFTLTYYGSQDPTFLSSPTMNEATPQSHIYNLQGQRINTTLQPGVYIRNGRKYVK